MEKPREKFVPSIISSALSSLMPLYHPPFGHQGSDTMSKNHLNPIA
jgi:dGTP triphosphohydrolase